MPAPLCSQRPHGTTLLGPQEINDWRVPTIGTGTRTCVTAILWELVATSQITPFSLRNSTFLKDVAEARDEG